MQEEGFRVFLFFHFLIKLPNQMLYLCELQQIPIAFAKNLCNNIKNISYFPKERKCFPWQNP